MPLYEITHLNACYRKATVMHPNDPPLPWWQRWWSRLCFQTRRAVSWLCPE